MLSHFVFTQFMCENKTAAMTVVTPELKSFVTKFAELWHSGRNASLALECGAGEATINLQLRLGSHPLHLQQPQHYQGPQHHLERRVGPSRLRRRARRAQAREVAAEQAAAAALQASASSSSTTNDKADQAALNLQQRAEKDVQVDVILSAEEAVHAEHPKAKVNVDAVVQTDASVKKNAAVQVDRPVIGLSHPHAMQEYTLPPPPPHQPLPAVLVADAFCPDQDYQDSPGIPQLDGPMPSNEEWSCKCCMYETFYKTEDELEYHHDTAHSFIEYKECNICYNGHVWT